MANISAMTAPQAQTMSPSDHVHEANMARYARDVAEFESSPDRQRAAQVTYIAAAAGALGCFVVAPVLGATVSNPLALGITVGVSAVSCFSAGVAMDSADIPCAPTHPDQEHETYG